MQSILGAVLTRSYVRLLDEDGFVRPAGTSPQYSLFTTAGFAKENANNDDHEPGPCDSCMVRTTFMRGITNETL
jgi:hypothetical protein